MRKVAYTLLGFVILIALIVLVIGATIIITVGLALVVEAIAHALGISIIQLLSIFLVGIVLVGAFGDLAYELGKAAVESVTRRVRW